MTLYKIAGAKCDQATLDEKCSSDAKSFAGLSEDTCAVQGYTVPAGDQGLNVPVVGSIMVELFAKAAKVSRAEAVVWLYKITGTKCGQATLDKKCASVAKSFAGSSEGIVPRRATSCPLETRR